MVGEMIKEDLTSLLIFPSSIVHKEGDIENNIRNRLAAGWLKW